MFEARAPVGDGPSMAALWRDAVGVAPVMMLAAEPVTGRSSGELLEMLAGWERQAAWVAGRQSALIAQIAGQIRSEYETHRAEQEARGLPPSVSDQTIENDIEVEVATALRLSSVTAGRR